MNERTHEQNLEFIDGIIEQGRIAASDDLSDSQYPEITTQEQAEFGWQILKAFSLQTCQAAYTASAETLSEVDRNDPKQVAEAALTARAVTESVHAVNDCASRDAANFFVNLMFSNEELDAA